MTSVLSVSELVFQMATLSMESSFPMTKFWARKKSRRIRKNYRHFQTMENTWNHFKKTHSDLSLLFLENRIVKKKWSFSHKKKVKHLVEGRGRLKGPLGAVNIRFSPVNIQSGEKGL